MKLTLLSVGQRMPSWVEDGLNEYLKRMPRECNVAVQEIALGKRSKTTDLIRCVQDEGERMLKAIKPGSYVVALDLTGKNWSTQALADKMQAWQGTHEQIYFLIGGPDGLDARCLARADETWCLSNLTFPHPLVRVILAEQLYRAWSLMQGHPYHR